MIKTAAKSAVSLPHVHVLILDDDAASRVRIHHALRVMGVMHVTEVASDGQAKNMPSLRTVDLIISDLALGLGNGLALLKAIRLGRVPGIRADVPYIFVSDVAYPRMISAADCTSCTSKTSSVARASSSRTPPRSSALRCLRTRSKSVRAAS